MSFKQKMDMLPDRSIFLAGVPTTGKTYFGNWLEENRNYLHIDVEKNQSVHRHNLQNEVSNFWNGNYSPLFNRLRDSGKPIVFDYGFPPQHLSTIVRFLNYGLKPVWFTATKEIAREKFLERGVIDIKYFDIQMNRIENYKNELINVFGKCEIKTPLDDGSRLSPEEIYENINKIFG